MKSGESSGWRNKSQLTGLIGRGIALSRSPEIHETEAAVLGIPLAYRLIDFATLGLGNERLGEAVDWAERLGFAGLNVTYPFKQAIVPHLHELSDEAQSLEAVNTIVFKDGKRIGRNTDWHGYMTAFRHSLPHARMDKVAQIGAGGAASAVAYAMLSLGAKHLSIHDIDRARAEALVAKMTALFPGAAIERAESAASAIGGADGAIQATPVGMAGHPGTPFDPALLNADQWVSDIVYVPLETELLRAARRLGCATVNGAGMVVMQAAAAFAEFTGVTPDSARMLRAFAAASAASAGSQ